jgi:hypothetical protein
MFSRRDLIAGGAAFAQARPVPAAAQQGSDNGAELLAIRDELRELRRLPGASALSVVRDRQRAFFKQNQRYPDFLDIGLNVWEGILDWHVANQQEIKMARTTEGRYTIAFLLSTLVLRPDFSDEQVSVGYDR